METHTFVVRDRSNRAWGDVMRIAEAVIAWPHALREGKRAFDDLYVEREERVKGEPGVSLYHGTYRL